MLLFSSYPPRSLFHKIALPGLLSRYTQIIEVRHRISFCPQSDLASIFERIVRCFDFLSAVVVTNDLVSDALHAQLMPFAGSDFEICACKLAAVSRDDVVEPVVILQSVGADDVIVVCVLQTKHEPTCAVHLARDSFESYAELEIFEASFICNQSRKAIVSRVRGSLRNYIRF